MPNTSLINMSLPSYDDDADIAVLNSNFQMLDDWLKDNVISRHDDMFNDFIINGLQPSTTTNVLVHDCDSLWDEISPSSGITVVLDTFDYKQGSGCLKINMDSNAGVGILASKALSPIDLRDTTGIKLWVKSNVNTNAGDYSLLLSKSPMSQQPIVTLPFPALVANSWTLITLPFSDVSELYDIISVSVKMNVDMGICSLWIDYVNAINFASTISSGTAYIKGHRIVKPEVLHTFSENKDTYIYLDVNSDYIFKEVAIGGNEPLMPPDTIKIARVITSSYNIIEVIDLRNMSAMVVSPTLTDGQVTESKLATDSVSTNKIKNNAVTSVKIATDAILSYHIKDSQIINAKLKDGDISLGNGTHASKAGKLNAEFRTFTVRGNYDSYNPEDVIAHGLNRIPKGYLLVSTDKPVQLYSGNSLWTNTHIYLKGTTANAVVTIMIF
ncbi:hypothetical protein EDM57_21025 [Brevibacillus gelatini]|uniref:Uncharacterized protein n=1 Tax=Brevibacillus gelatini TaxID=1655277 RepID=A0A3M8AN96_9BACL|nr:hypothetical protein [Brevibacillus gelatini]RNB52672.1 hypothetical protein EDM57_21025 [Brevibacillus gelatini]